MAPGDQETYELVVRVRDEAKRALRDIVGAGRTAGNSLRTLFSSASRESQRFRRIATGAFDAVRRAAGSLGNIIRRVLRPGLGQIAALFLGFAAIRSAAAQATDFGRAMAEVSTIVDTSVVSVEGLTEGVLDLARAQGVNETLVSRGLYQAISAGVQAGAESIEFLGEASELAIAGVAETSEAVDLLTSSLNAYNLAGRAATERFADIAFRTVQLGKTTIPELSGALGRATPLAAQLGVQFEEVSAAVASITLSGQSTSEAVTQLAGLFRALLRVGGEVDQLFQDRLGKRFTEQTLRTEGLFSVLQDLQAATGGSTRALVELLGEAEAVNAVLNLTGSNATRFASALDQIQNSAGAAQQAFEKQINAPANVVRRTMNALRIEFLGVGTAVVESVARQIDAVGGVDRVAQNFSIITRALAGALDRSIERIGILLERFATLTDSAGGAERVGDVVLSAIEALSASFDFLFSVLANGLENLVAAIASIPAAIDKLRFSLSKIPGLEGIFEISDPEVQRLEARLEEVRKRIQDRLFETDPDSTSGIFGLADDQVLDQLRRVESQVSAQLRAAREAAEAELARGDGKTLFETITGNAEDVRASGEKALDAIKDTIAQFRSLGAPTEAPAQGTGLPAGESQLALFEAETGAAAKALESRRSLLAIRNQELEAIQRANELDVAAQEQRVQAAQVFGSLQAQLLSQASLSLEEQLALQGRIAEIRDQDIRLAAQEAGISREQLEQLLAISQRIRDENEAAIRLSETGFVSFAAEQARLTSELVLTTEQQVRAIRDWQDAELARIDLLIAENALTAEQADNLRGVVAELAKQREGAARAANAQDTLAASLGRLGGQVLNRVADGIGDVAVGYRTLGDVGKQVIEDLIRGLIRLAVRQAILAAIGGPGSSAAAFLGLARGGITPGPLKPIAGFARGGVLPGGIQAAVDTGKIVAAQTGGLFQSPTLAAIAEGGRPEAVVPLTGNRRIPVQLMEGGGGRGGFQFNISFGGAPEAEGFDRRLAAAEDTLVRVVARAMTYNSEFKSVVRTAVGAQS